METANLSSEREGQSQSGYADGGNASPSKVLCSSSEGSEEQRKKLLSKPGGRGKGPCGGGLREDSGGCHWLQEAREKTKGKESDLRNTEFGGKKKKKKALYVEKSIR